MWTFIEITNIIFEALIVFYFLNGIYRPAKFPFKRGMLVYFVYVALLAVLTFAPVSPIIRIIYSLLSTWCICALVYRSSILDSVYVSLVFITIVMLADQLCILVLNSFGINIESTMTSGSARTMSIVVSKLIVLAMMQLVIALIHKRARLNSPLWILPLIVGQFISVLIVDLIFQMALSSNADEGRTIIAILGLLYLNFIICIYVESIKQSWENKRRNDLAQQQLQMQIEHYEKVQMERESTRSLWHDIKKYVFAMQTMLDKEQDDEAYQCFLQAQKALTEIRQTVDVGNVVVDGILEQALLQAQKKDIKIEFDVWIPSSIPVTAVDLSIIMGNTIDNAIEACTAITDSCIDKKIEILLKQQNKMLFYEIINPKSINKPPKLGGIHGYGLKNVRRCIEKYEGTLDIQNQENTFMLVAQIPVV